MATQTYRENAWTCFFCGLVICAILAFVVYLIEIAAI